MTGEALDARLMGLDAIDQHFARTTLDFLRGMHGREVLDHRTRSLVQIGQFTITGSLIHLDDALRYALGSGIAAREALESILLCQVYAGDTAVVPAVRVFTAIADELGILASLRDDQLPLDGRDSERRLDEERMTWRLREEDEPLRDTLIERHGWLGVSTGIQFRGRHHLDLLAHRDELDPTWADLWLRFTYQDMYSRRILDDRTRIICTVGDTLAVGDFVQARAHIVEALKIGIPPRQIMEIVFLIGPYFGSPKMAASLVLFEKIIEEEGRTAEIGRRPEDPADGSVPRPG
jgi:alkylhydroperoxidase/carboxymuconolactone decarboxylase family protein YurZ